MMTMEQVIRVTTSVIHSVLATVVVYPKQLSHSCYLARHTTLATDITGRTRNESASSLVVGATSVTIVGKCIVRLQVSNGNHVGGSHAVRAMILACGASPRWWHELLSLHLRCQRCMLLTIIEFSGNELVCLPTCALATPGFDRSACAVAVGLIISPLQCLSDSCKEQIVGNNNKISRKNLSRRNLRDRWWSAAVTFFQDRSCATFNYSRTELSTRNNAFQ